MKTRRMPGDVDDRSAARDSDLWRFIPYLAFLLAAVTEVVAIGFLNRGRIIYTIDDPYIHLALAEHISAGTYGINAGESAAPASSILWPFILSLFSKYEFFALVPCALNLGAALGTLMVMERVTYRAVEADPRTMSAPWVAALITLLIPATNLIPLALTGMEHSFQQLLAVVIVAGLIEESRAMRAPPYLWAAIVLAPLVRYESLALCVPALVYLVQRRHLSGSAVAAVIVIGSLGVFSWFLKSHGLGYLPTSVLAKSDVMSNPGSVHALLLTLYGNLVRAPQGTPLLLGVMLLTATALSRNRPVGDRGLAAAIAAAILLHLTLGRVDGYRYEAYLSATALLTLIHLHRDWLRAAFRVGDNGPTRVAVLGSLLAVSAGYIFALATTPLAANNIYGQQYQLHRFAVDYYKGPVAVNDLGWVAFQNPRYVLDLWGLGSQEAGRARESDPSGEWMDRLCREHGVDLILIYERWFPNHPSNWIRLGSLKVLRPVITLAFPQVEFYARDSASAARARLALVGFTRSLPEGVTFMPDTATMTR
jgi:hypothetical protein